MVQSNRLTRHVFWGMYAVACVEFLHYYASMVTPYLYLARYLAGTERLPYQARLLPLAVLWPLLHARALLAWITGRGWHAPPTITEGAAAAALLAWAVLAYAAACYYTVRLYRAVSQDGRLTPLVLLTLLYSCIWSYALHIYRNLAFPYDLSALACLTAGILFIYQRRFLPLCLAMLIGTLNRETTLFLIPIFLLDAIAIASPADRRSLASRLRAAPWARAGLLFCLWAAVHFSLLRLFSHNDQGEAFARWHDNLADLSLRHLPGILNACGFLLPALWLLRRQIEPSRFGAYIQVLPLWIVVMAWKAMLLESRIHGEFGGYAAVGSVLLLERYLRQAQPLAQQPTTAQPAAEVQRLAS